MILRFACSICIVTSLALGSIVTHAQDVPGVEICTVEKTMERRTSCLQSNVEFLHKTITRLDLEHRQKLDAAKAQIEALKANLASLQKVADDLRAAQQKQVDDSKKKADAAPSKDASKDASPTKDAAKEGVAKEGGK